MQNFVLSSAVLACAVSAASGDTYHLAGTQSHTAFTLAATDRIVATADLKIVGSSSVTIEGNIEGNAGVSIEITAPVVYLSGVIRGGDGASTTTLSESGQDGGSIIVNAAVIYVDGATLEGGRGGGGGPEASGGNGGSVLFVDCSEMQILSESMAIGGNGGDSGVSVRGTLQGTTPIGGGNGGDAIVPCQMQDAPATPPDCSSEAGVNGGAGMSAIGGNGGNGRDGVPGSVFWPDGRNGRHGGHGGSATAGSGGPGGNGSSCCSPTPGPGGKGGDGGTGGNATGGDGGKGGKGGNAWWVGARSPWTHDWGFEGECPDATTPDRVNAFETLCGFMS